MIKVDLHTHSEASPDGGLAASDYRRAIKDNMLDVVAITDHDTISFAQAMHRELGDKIIVGQEISTSDGDLIGLFLNDKIAPGQTAAQSADAIKSQDGLVYIPHPFEKLRKSLQRDVIESIADKIDILETFNGRTTSKHLSKQAEAWAEKTAKPAASSSDAHGVAGWCNTYTEINALPSRNTLAKLLAEGSLRRQTVGTIGRLYPKLNRLKKRYRK